MDRACKACSQEGRAVECTHRGTEAVNTAATAGQCLHPISTASATDGVDGTENNINWPLGGEASTSGSSYIQEGSHPSPSSATPSQASSSLSSQLPPPFGSSAGNNEGLFSMPSVQQFYYNNAGAPSQGPPVPVMFMPPEQMHRDMYYPSIDPRIDGSQGHDQNEPSVTTMIPSSSIRHGTSDRPHAG